MQGTADEAIERLVQGNHQFVDGLATPAPRSRLGRLAEHRPFAIVVGCSDGRVIPEALFDAATGELFVIRVAGNVLSPTQVGSIEYAIARFSTPLVVVLGHTDCAAVAAAYENLRGERLPGPLAWSANVEGVLGPIRSTILPRLYALPAESAAALACCVEANVLARVADLGRSWPKLDDLLPGGRLAIAGAVYDVATGAVRFLDPAAR